MNNGMTAKKLRILQSKLSLISYELRQGQISPAVALTDTQIVVRDMRIYNGLEKAYLQG